MPRIAIDKATIRARLEPRREPYWGPPIARGVFLGFRRLEHGGTWIARSRDESGAQRYHSLGEVSAALDFEHARKAALAWTRQLLAGVEPSTVRTVSDAARYYVEGLVQAGRASTAYDAAGRFERTVHASLLGKCALDKVTTRALTQWHQGMVAAGLSKASANRTLTALKAALNLAVQDRRVSAERRIEWASVKPYGRSAIGGRRDLYLDRDQRRALVAAATGAGRDLIEAAALTGARAGELTSATRGQLDLRTGMLTLRGKTGERTVPLLPAALDLFKRLARGKLPNAHLLTRDDGKPWPASGWDHVVRAAAASAGLPAGVCLYTLRHSWITAALSDSAHPLSTLEVARLVGTSLTMIERHYGHLAASAARDRLALIGIA
jgi:integrase